MEIDKCKGLNFPNSLECKKQEKEQKAKPLQKSVEASSLDALNALGRAQVNMSFKGSFSVENAEYKELTDEEFEEYKAKLDEKISQLPKDVQNQTAKWKINKINIQLADKIISDERLYNNELVKRYASSIIFITDTPEQVQVADKILSDEKIYNNKGLIMYAEYIISLIETNEQAEIICKIIDKILSNERLYNNVNVAQYVIRNIISNICTPEQLLTKGTIIDKLLSDERLLSNQFVIKNMSSIIDKLPRYLSESDIKILDTLIDKVMSLKNIVINHPEMYISGEFDSIDEMNNEVNAFFNEYAPELVAMSSVFDTETMDVLLHKRFSDAGEYIDTFSNLNSTDIKLLKDISNSYDVNGKSFKPNQKIEFIDLITAYKENNLDTSKIQKMIEKGRIDTEQLNIDLFNGILKNCGFTEEEISQIPAEKLTGWDTKYAHLLSKEISEADLALVDLLRAGNFDDLKRYIQDESNIYGQTNAKTKASFEEKGMNYNVWLNPSDENNVQFHAKDKNLEQLEQIVLQITEDIEALRQTPANGFVDKQFAKYIKNGEFVIPTEFTTSKAKLEEFTKNILKQLEPVFKRAEGNINNPAKAQTAQNTLTIKDHLNQRLADISNVSDSKSTKTLDLTIKMWNRVPQKDIFQGNYSTCCIGMGNGNGSAMPHYLLNTAYNMIELVDNKSGKTIGNALCYFITDESGKPAFVIDNIEIRNSDKPSDEVGIELRNAIVEYASNVAKDVTGTNDTPIYMSSNYNDVSCQDLKTTKQQISFLGDTDCDEIYMDLYDGWVDKEKYSSEANLLKLK